MDLLPDELILNIYNKTDPRYRSALALTSRKFRDISYDPYLVADRFVELYEQTPDQYFIDIFGDIARRHNIPRRRGLSLIEDEEVQTIIGKKIKTRLYEATESAIINGLIPLAKSIIEENNLDPNQPIDDSNLLFDAVQSGDLDFVKYLVARGGSLDYVASNGDSILIPASQSNPIVLAWLLTTSARKFINKPGYYYETPLNSALFSLKYLDNAKLLLDSGAQPDTKDLIKSIKNGNLPLVRKILQKGVVPTQDMLNTAFKKKDISMVNLLAEFMV